MTLPILATKLYIPPPRPNLVLRPRLIEKLNQGLQTKMTLISAPAGFGKTTLVSEWAAGPWHRPPGQVCDQKVAWLSLDKEDSDLSRFLTYLVAALQTIAANIGKGVLSFLQSSQLPPTESILTTLLNEITLIPESFVLVLDDYHVIDSKWVDEALAFLLKHLPPEMHLVVTTREDPQLPLAQLRARGHLAELRIADLRFTLSESAEFLNQMMGLNITSENIAVLESRTEGWIAGLQLAAISMQGQQDTTSFINSFTGSHHFVLDYLIEEVLQRQPENIQSFLLRTSILDRLCGPLCDAVLCDSSVSGQETLEYLERTNLFIIPLDNKRCWYRYHNLFADLLRQRLGKTKEFAEFNLRASHWYEENGDLGAAFHHAIAAGDFVRAARLAEAAWQGMNDSFQMAAWLGWVEKLPEEIIRVRPVLCTLLGRAFTDVGELETSEMRLQNAERCLVGMDVANEAQLKPLPAIIALGRAFNAQVQGDLAATVKYAELALKIIPEEDIARRAQAFILLEVTHWANGNLESALRGLGDWMESMTRLGNHIFVVASAFAAADLQVDLGRLSEAERTYKDALQLAAQHGPEAEHITAHHHLGLSMIYRQRGEDLLAAHHLEQAAKLGQQTTLVDWKYRWCMVQAQLKEAAGDLVTALALLDEAKQAYIQTAVPDLRPVAALKARINLKQGRPDKVRLWVSERRLTLADEVSYLHEFEYITLARLEVANPLVNSLLSRLLQAAEAQKRQGNVIEILVVQALAHEAQSDHSQALAALERALALAEPENYIRIFIDEGAPLENLLNNIRTESKNLKNYIQRLKAAFIGKKPQFSVTNQQLLIEPLSERELEVLKLLRTQLSGPEIAGQLIISLNTFRTHTKNIFNKLGVNNRRAAVQQAEELDLI